MLECRASFQRTERYVVCPSSAAPRRAAASSYVENDIESRMAPTDKPLVWLRGEVKSPPFSAAARLEAGWLLRRLQAGEKLGMPHSRPMPTIGRG